MTEQRVLIIIPTYNEADNVEQAVRSVNEALPSAHVLVVDDGSPDGTGAIADGLAIADTRVSVLHRTEKSGLGGAYLAGFELALRSGYDVIGEFDADGSHPASALPAMLHALMGRRSPSLVIGSRWVPGGSVVDWPKSREALSRAGNAYARLVLRVPVRDATGGFRLFRADVLRDLDLAGIESKGYCFQVDMTVRVHDGGGVIAEVPIEFRERQLGTSKMSQAIVLEAMAKVTLWGLQRGIAGVRGGKAGRLLHTAGKLHRTIPALRS